MALPEFKLKEPKTIEELEKLLQKHGEHSKILAGGTDLIPALRDRAHKPKTIINIKNIEKLNKIQQTEEELVIGATVTADQLTKTEEIEEYSALNDALNVHSDPILRNRATLIGNLCTASPAGDTPPALLIHNTKIDIQGPNTEKTIKLENFFTGVKQNTLEEDEYVKQIRIPKPHKNTKTAYLKWKRNEGEDLAVVGIAAEINQNNELQLALSSVAPTPKKIPNTKNTLKQGTKQEKINEAVKKVQKNISPITDTRGNAEYRNHMAKQLTQKILKQLMEEK